MPLWLLQHCYFEPPPLTGWLCPSGWAPGGKRAPSRLGGGCLLTPGSGEGPPERAAHPPPRRESAFCLHCIAGFLGRRPKLRPPSDTLEKLVSGANWGCVLELLGALGVRGRGGRDLGSGIAGASFPQASAPSDGASTGAAHQAV